MKAGSPSRLPLRAPKQAGRPLAITAETAVIRGVGEGRGRTIFPSHNCFFLAGFNINVIHARHGIEDSHFVQRCPWEAARLTLQILSFRQAFHIQIHTA